MFVYNFNIVCDFSISWHAHGKKALMPAGEK